MNGRSGDQKKKPHRTFLHRSACKPRLGRIACCAHNFKNVTSINGSLSVHGAHLSAASEEGSINTTQYMVWDAFNMNMCT